MSTICDDVAWICDDVVKLQIIHLIILLNTFCEWMKSDKTSGLNVNYVYNFNAIFL
jgi:hypothetical protein